MRVISDEAVGGGWVILGPVHEISYYSYAPSVSTLTPLRGLRKSDLKEKLSKMLSQRALLVIVKLVTPRVRVRVGVRVRVSFIFNILF